MSNKRFDQWAIVELFGHQKIAGRVSEQVIGGCSFVRVDVPETENETEKAPAFTKLYGNGAIYAITITDEKSARMAARTCVQEPMDVWTVNHLIKSLPGAGQGETHEEEQPPY
jgi:hypothetical protein